MPQDQLGSGLNRTTASLVTDRSSSSPQVDMSGVSLKELLSRMSDDAETLRLHILPNIDISPIYLAYDTVTRNLSWETI